MYRVFRRGDGRKVGAFVDMLPTREEAEAHARGLEGEHEVVGLLTREVPAEESGLWTTVVLLSGGIVAAEGSPVERDAEE